MDKQKILWIGGSIIALVVVLFGAWKMTTVEKKPEAVNVSVTTNDRVKGPEKAKNTIVEYSDFQCPSCKAHQPLISELLKKHPKDLKIIYRPFPLVTIHQNARISAQVAEAASLQGKFWEMHDLLFENQEDWGEEKKPMKKFESFAKELKLDMVKFKKDIESKEVIDKVDGDMQSGNSIGVGATPTFIVNGKKLPQVRSLQDFEKEFVK